METEIFFIRHAQSHQSSKVHHEKWPLSVHGESQALKLAKLLANLEIEKIYSSPFKRCLQTVGPYIQSKNIPVEIHQDLRERHLFEDFCDINQIWIKAWEDFNFKLPNCECSNSAQQRFLEAVKAIAERHPGSTVGISTHGFVIALFLNHLDQKFSRLEAEKIRNPEVLKIIYKKDGSFSWDRSFSLEGLDLIATHHSATPVEK